jgi:hypothetical protein
MSYTRPLSERRSEVAEPDALARDLVSLPPIRSMKVVDSEPGVANRGEVMGLRRGSCDRHSPHHSTGASKYGEARQRCRRVSRSGGRGGASPCLTRVTCSTSPQQLRGSV